MEEWVGERWHRFIWRAADTSHPHAAVRLQDVERAVQMLFRAGGGDPVVRVAAATAQKVGGPRGWLQKLAGQGERAELATLDDQTLALPPVLAVFADAALNRQLYLWLAAQGACLPAQGAGQGEGQGGWLAANLHATAVALQRFAGLRSRYARLVRAHLAQRPPAQRLQGSARVLEEAICNALQHTLQWAQQPELALSAPAAIQALANPPGLPASAADWRQPEAVSPVWLWLQAQPLPESESKTIAQGQENTGANGQSEKQPDKAMVQDERRRRAQRTQDTSTKDGLVMFFRAESIFSWAEFVRVNRTSDDEDNQDWRQVADDMQQLAIAQRQTGETLAARIKFDLDLPSAAADDLPVGEGIALPEWDHKRQLLLPGHCRAQCLRHRGVQVQALPGASPAAAARAGMPPAAVDAPAQGDAAASVTATDAAVAAAAADMARRLRGTSRQVRRRFEALRAAPRWQHGLVQGEELDVDAWVRHRVDTRNASGRPRSEQPAIYSRRVRSERSLACLMLADLSLSTDAYATQQARVIDLVRDSLWVFGNALHAVGDPFEMLGFSSVRRQVRIHELKRFDEAWNDAARERVAAIKPGFYTRMGAAIRYGTLRLGGRGERQRLLLILTDGKPNDLDHYEGRHGLQDTRHAVLAARQAGLVPFCVTIDQKANAYLPHLFGMNGWVLVHRPEQLARALTQVYIGLTAAAR